MKLSKDLQRGLVTMVVACCVHAADAATTFTATLTAAQEVPATNSSATGVGTVILNDAGNQVTATISWAGLSSTQTGASIHAPAPRGATAGVLRTLPAGSPATVTFAVSPFEMATLRSGLWYFSVQSANFPGGEIRGQIEPLCTPPPAGLVAFYKGEGNPNDSSAFASHGSMRNGATFGSGRIGQAFKLDGVDDFVAFADEDYIDLTGDLTIAAWIRPDVSSGRQQVIASKRSLDNGNVEYTLFLENDGRLAFTSRINNGAFLTVYANVSVGPLPTDRFTHVAVTLQGGNLTFYVNGDEGGVVSGYSGRAATAGRLTIGAVELSIGNSAHFGGLIDEVQVFNRAASAAQITRLAQNITSGVCTGAADFPSVVGMLDTSFDRDGKILASVGEQGGYLQDVAIQPDGKIIAFGTARRAGTFDFMVLRFNVDGSLDSSFRGESGTDNGVVKTDVSGVDFASAVALQADGKIVVAGDSVPTNGDFRFAFARYNTDGTLDQTFDGDSGTANGKFTTTLGERVGDIAIQPDGRIIVVGESAENEFVVLRFTTDGKLDPSFGTNGRVTTAIGEVAAAKAVALQPDGKIVVTGYGATPNLPPAERLEFAVVRYNSDGTLDTSFDGDSGTGNGRVVTAISSKNDFPSAVAIQPDGKIIVAGSSGGAVDQEVITALARYHPDGRLDTSFDGDGILLKNVAPGQSDYASSIELQQDGKIVTAGSAVGAGKLEFAILRYNADGSLDSTFDGDSGAANGQLIIPIGMDDDFAHGTALSNGRIIVVGSAAVNTIPVVVRCYANQELTAVDSSTALLFGDVAVAGTTVATPLDRAALPPLPNGLNYIPESVVTDVRTSAGFAGDVLVRFTLPASVDQQTFGALVVLHLENNAWVDRTVNAPDAPVRDFASRTIYGRASSLSPWVVVSTTPPPSAPTRLANISTRLQVQTGNDVLIGGLIITGNQPKKVIVRAIGTSLPLAGNLQNPVLELHGPNGLIEANDNWIDSPNKQAIIDSTIPPPSDLEAAIVQTLPANGAGYTAIVRGANNSTGIGVVEAYDLDASVDSRLANISTRGFVQTGDNVLIAGTIVVGSQSQKVIVRAIGPSLPFPGTLANPTLELRDGNGGLLEENDDWVNSPNKQAIIDSTIPPSNDLEPAIVRTLAPAAYTAIVRGANNTNGIAVVEVYALN